MKTYKDKKTALAAVGKELSSQEDAGAIYPCGAVRWRFKDGSMAVCHKWAGSFLVSWIIT